MEVIQTNIEGVVIIEPRLFKDDRGYFFESYSERDFNRQVGEIHFVQDNESKSSYGVMRGLHFQRPPFTQSKLVRCVKGAVLDGSRHPQRQSYLRTACSRRINRRQSPSILYPERIRSWICCTESGSHLPVQMRQFLPSRSRRRYQHPRYFPGH